jgi:hypothetical protein
LAYIRSDPIDPVQPVSWAQLLRYRQTWAFALGKGLTDPIWWFYLFWLPKFLDARYGIKLAQLAAPLIVIYLLADVGSVFGGWLSGAFIKRGWSVNAGRKMTMLIAALLIVPTMFAPAATNMWVAVCVVGVAAAAHQWWSANIFTLPSDMFPWICRGIGGRNRRVLWRGRRLSLSARHGLAVAAKRQQLHADFSRVRTRLRHGVAGDPPARTACRARVVARAECEVGRVSRRANVGVVARCSRLLRNWRRSAAL